MSTHHIATSDRDYLVHLCAQQDWKIRREREVFYDPTFCSEKFLHLSTPEQVHIPANALYSHRYDLVLLWIDIETLRPFILWEQAIPPATGGMIFPHLYGSLPTASIRAVHRYTPDEQGTFHALSRSK